MVFVWSLLVGGNPSYTLMQVAANDAVMLVLYLPTMLLLLNASSVPIPYELIAFSVALFVAAPLTMAIICRKLLLAKGGQELLDEVISILKPVTTVGLLSTLVIIFIYQGETIGNKPIHILMIMVPQIIQTFLVFGLTFYVGYMICVDFRVLAPASMISTSNFFELAVAIAMSIYGPQSGAALATVVGVLVEVPLMLVLVQICLRFRPNVEKRCSECETKCKLLGKIGRCGREPGSAKFDYAKPTGAEIELV